MPSSLKTFEPLALATGRIEVTFSSQIARRYRVRLVEGNGFGCVMLRGNVLKESLFTCRQPPYDFDPAFYERLKQTGDQAKRHWDAECEHLSVG